MCGGKFETGRGSAPDKIVNKGSKSPQPPNSGIYGGRPRLKMRGQSVLRLTAPLTFKGSQYKGGLDMSDVEFVTQRNWEQRRHAEEYAAQLEEKDNVIYLEQIAAASAEPRNDRQDRNDNLKRKNCRIARAARTAGRLALVVSTASALAGMELVFPAFGLVAVIFYTIYFEKRGRCALWHRI